jgi:hypothetical protein
MLFVERQVRESQSDQGLAIRKRIDAECTHQDALAKPGGSWGIKHLAGFPNGASNRQWTLNP